jgi:hypothetical protein
MTAYFGVIGNRDYIKLGGDKRPFWEFLDEQPAGWLTSLVYKRKDVPSGKPMIWDCGAWSYRMDKEPRYTPRQCAEMYKEFAPHGSMVIAPDHMLIPGVDNVSRREINLKNAGEFLSVVESAHVPMATVHGETLGERVDAAIQLRALGYRHIAIGGVAAQAARKAMATEIVQTIRAAVPDVYLHVLGLSSPEYARRWNEIGVDSFDGSSHFKQAFTAGAWFSRNGAKLIKHQAARPGEDVSIVSPQCECRACVALRQDGVDTRSYGSNEHNMGRAAHNLNVLMQAQRAAITRTIVLVACCGKKLPYAAPAKELYQSELFRKSRAYAEQNGDSWLILSALHGVVHPDATIAPYDVTLNEMSRQARADWSVKVAGQLEPHRSSEMVVLAGKNYCGWVEHYERVTRPMEGLGIGQQLAFLTERVNPQGGLF